MTTSGRRPRVGRPARRVLAAYGGLLVLLLLLPFEAVPTWCVERLAELAGALGLPAAVAAPGTVEPLLNVAAFAPLSFLGSVLRPSLTWRDWTTIGFVASLVVEAVQALALDERTAAPSDVVANTIGSLLGALAARPVTRPASD